MMVGKVRLPVYLKGMLNRKRGCEMISRWKCCDSDVGWSESDGWRSWIEDGVYLGGMLDLMIRLVGQIP